MVPDPNVVISFIRRGVCVTPPPPDPIQITLPVDIDRLPGILMHLTVAAELATRVALKREFGDETVLEGIRQVFQAFANIVSL